MSGEGAFFGFALHIYLSRFDVWILHSYSKRKTSRHFFTFVCLQVAGSSGSPSRPPALLDSCFIITQQHLNYHEYHFITLFSVD
jgi:hypothetical protein